MYNHMFVYGVRCAPADLVDLPSDAEADYYMDYGLLVFPGYTRATCIHSHGHVTPAFWGRAKGLLENPGRIRSVELEHPWITEEEDNVIRALCSYYPSLEAGWYYVPHAVIRPVNDVDNGDGGDDGDDESDGEMPALHVYDDRSLESVD